MMNIINMTAHVVWRNLPKDITSLSFEFENRKYPDIIDHEFFIYMNYKQLETTSFIHAIYLTGHEYSITTSNEKTY